MKCLYLNFLKRHWSPERNCFLSKLLTLSFHHFSPPAFGVQTRQRRKAIRLLTKRCRNKYAGFSLWIYSESFRPQQCIPINILNCIIEVEFCAVPFRTAKYAKIRVGVGVCSPSYV